LYYGWAGLFECADQDLRSFLVPLRPRSASIFEGARVSLDERAYVPYADLAFGKRELEQNLALNLTEEFLSRGIELSVCRIGGLEPA
jgi:hypothetical protein